MAALRSMAYGTWSGLLQLKMISELSKVKLKCGATATATLRTKR